MTQHATSQKDSVVSKLMLNVLFKAVLSLPKSDELAELKQNMKGSMLPMLHRGVSSDLVAALLALAQTANLKIQAGEIRQACERTKAYYDGIKALELQAVPLPLDVPVVSVGSKKRQSTGRNLETTQA